MLRLVFPLVHKQTVQSRKWEMGITETGSTSRHLRVTVSVYLGDKKKGTDRKVRYLQRVAAL